MILNEELVNELMEEYGVEEKTVLKYAKRIIEDYPFVVEDEEKFNEFLTEVISTVVSAEIDYENDKKNNKLPSELNKNYSETISYSMDRLAEEIYPESFKPSGKNKIH